MSSVEEPQSREPIDVHMVLAVMMDQLADLAWQKLGLRHDVGSGKIAPNLSQAKSAIDVIVSISKILDPHLDDEDRRQVQGMVRDLQINYVERNQGNA